MARFTGFSWHRIRIRIRIHIHMFIYMHMLIYIYILMYIRREEGLSRREPLSKLVFEEVSFWLVILNAVSLVISSLLLFSSATFMRVVPFLMRVHCQCHTGTRVLYNLVVELDFSRW